MVARWKLLFSKQAQRHAKHLKKAGLSEKAHKVLKTIKEDPFSLTHSFEKLVGDLKSFYSKRINIKHRIVYKIDKENLTVHIYAMWSHYEE